MDEVGGRTAPAIRTADLHAATALEDPHPVGGIALHFEDRRGELAMVAVVIAKMRDRHQRRRQRVDPLSVRPDRYVGTGDAEGARKGGLLAPALLRRSHRATLQEAVLAASASSERYAEGVEARRRCVAVHLQAYVT